MTTILEISASGRKHGSITRLLTGELVDALSGGNSAANIIRRDLSTGIDFVDEQWIAANFTDPEKRSLEQRAALSESDALVEELKSADIVVIGAPIYNFGVPAALKAWIDMIARARLTFRYTDNGPVGLLSGKKAYVVVASGGVPIDSDLDFATPYLRQALQFVGINDIDVIAAPQGGRPSDDVLSEARATIADLVEQNHERQVA